MAETDELVRRAVEAAAGGESLEGFAVESRRTQVKAHGGTVESLSFAESRGLGVRVIVDGRLGYAYATDPDLEEVAGLVARARENAGLGTPDEANRLPEAVPFRPLDGIYRPALAAHPTEGKVALALDLERVATSALPQVRKLEEAAYGDAVSRVAIASTAGVAAEYARTDCWCSAFAIAEDGEDTQTGFDFRLGHELDDLDWETVARDAAERAARLLGAAKPGTERLPVLLDPLAAASFLGVLAGALSAESVQKGRSLFAGLVGEAVASAAVTLVDDGRFLDGPAASPFDDEGVPTGRTDLIGSGRLLEFLHNTVTARRGNTVSTGNASRGSYRTVPGVAPSNLFLEPGPDEPAALLARAGRAIYVQDVTGVHSGANPVSGEFSVGATGLRVADGTLAEPLREMTIASTLIEMLRAVEAVGADLRFGGAVGSPTVLVGEMTVAGT
ncbi:MAG TPA: TldD/PmbA family protein [Actinomycetota bacterium]|nr:TldD/PmbA family protein [Actinomycetota bacterium]